MITLDLEVRHMTFPPGLRDQASLAQKRGIIKKRVNDDLLALFSGTSARSRKLSIRESTLEYVLSKYSEQAVFEPRRELRHWFAYTGGSFILPGYAPLDYASGRLKQSVNVSVAQAIGEAVAGLVLQWEFGGQLLARPNHDFPDVVMEVQGNTLLGEAKASFDKSPNELLKSNLYEVAPFFANAYHVDPRPVFGALCATQILGPTQMKCGLLTMSFSSSAPRFASTSIVKMPVISRRTRMETALANLAKLSREGEKDLLKSPTAFDIAAEILREDMKERARRALDGEPILETGLLAKVERISAILQTNQSPRECTERIEQLMREAGKKVKHIEPQISQFGKALRTGGSWDESDQVKSGGMKSADELRYEIHIIGPPGMVRGLLAVPLTDQIVLDLPALQDVATTQEGSGLFPIECAVEGCELVIDDDGRVFAHIEQPGQENAIRDQLEILLQRLYAGESR